MPVVQPAASEPITLVISEAIAPDRLDEYEAWARGISEAAQRFDGFISTEMLRPRDNAYAEYVVIVRFESYDYLRRWVSSPVYRYWIEQSQGLVAKRSLRHMGGMEIWFSQSRSGANPEPPFYKKVILGVLAVYPLILLANVLLGQLLAPLPSLVGLFISVTFVSALLTYPVMPLLTKVLDSWLYPRSAGAGRSDLRR